MSHASRILAHDSSIELLEEFLFSEPICRLKSRLCYDSRLCNMWSAIEQNYCRPDFGLSQCCREVGMSKNSLNVLLRKITLNHTCGELLLAYRLYRSILRALEQNESFSEIAIECGFETLSGYSRAFSRVLGVPPSRFLARGNDYVRHINDCRGFRRAG